MKKLIVGLLFFWSFLYALEIPQTSKYDKKITYAVFNAHQVFRIASANGYVSVIEFGKDERIINTAQDLARVGSLPIKAICFLLSQRLIPLNISIARIQKRVTRLVKSSLIQTLHNGEQT